MNVPLCIRCWIVAPLLIVGLGACGRLGFELTRSPESSSSGGRSEGRGQDGGQADGGTFDGGSIVRPAAGRIEVGDSDVCVGGRCASDMDLCPTVSAVRWPGVCGCDGDAAADQDDDGRPDCIDLCPDYPDLLAEGTCGCEASSEDTDGDGVPNCKDLCPEDATKTRPGVCGCGVADDDSDGDGMPDCADTCGGSDDSRYISDATCGVGRCLTTNAPSTCSGGVEIACAPGTPLPSDATCDGVDDDCDGTSDEDYMAVASCGLGACLATSTPSSCSGGVENACAPGPPLADDDATMDGVDDDCDGAIDENVCISTPMAYPVGTYALVAPPGCGTVVVQMWGGGGGSSGTDSGPEGDGAAGGYVERAVPITGALDLHVGAGGGGCGLGGLNPGSADFGGGDGGLGDTLRSNPGAPGGDGVVLGGGPGGTQSGGSAGGQGHYGGGGGGAGGTAPWPPYPTSGGGGGAATVLVMQGAVVAAAGGGGGGGSPSGGSVPPYAGSAGGNGCAGAGADSSSGGGGGGGGVCLGDLTDPGLAEVPANESLLPGNEALGATGGKCRDGGDGYAVVVFGS